MGDLVAHSGLAVSSASQYENYHPAKITILKCFTVSWDSSYLTFLVWSPLSLCHLPYLLLQRENVNTEQSKLRDT